MSNDFVLREWADLCQRLTNSAQVLGRRADRIDSYSQEAAEFCSQDPPAGYPELLHRVSEAAALSKRWQTEESAFQKEEAESIDNTLTDSFPASDPPSWTTSAL